MLDLLTVTHWSMGSVMPVTLLSVAILSVLGKPERLEQTKCVWNNQFLKFPYSLMSLSDSNIGQA